jgi:hypothetical protein
MFPYGLQTSWYWRYTRVRLAPTLISTRRMSYTAKLDWFTSCDTISAMMFAVWTTSCATLWNILELDGTFWKILERYGTFWNIIETLWNIVEDYGAFWNIL